MVKLYGHYIFLRHKWVSMSHFWMCSDSNVKLFKICHNDMPKYNVTFTKGITKIYGQ